MVKKSFNILFHKNVFLLHSNQVRMKRIIPALFFISFILAACGDNEKTSAVKTKDKYEQTKETLEQVEKKNPIRFLTVEGTDKKNLIGQRVIKGIINNKATVAGYKDIDVEITFYSKTGTLLEKSHEVIYETIEAGNSTNFKTKYFAPKGTDSVALKIYTAKTD